MKKNIVSVALAVCMIGTTVPVAAADFSDVPAVENNSEFSDGNATDTCDSYTDVNLNFVYSENGETKSVDGELYPIKVPNKYVSGTYVTVPKAVLLEQLTAEGFSIPEGFEWNDDVISFDISDLPFGDMLEVELDKKQTVSLNYYDESAEAQIAEVPVLLSSKVTSVDLGEVNAHMPSGYVYAGSKNSLPIKDGYVYIPIKKEAKEVKINFYSEDEEKQIDESTIEVDKDATYVNTSAFANLVPSGYELVESGNLQIRDGYVYAAVEKVAVVKYKKVKLNFYNEKEETQVKEVTIKVKKTAKSVTVKEIQKSLPKNYTMTTTKTKLPIRDGYVYVAVTKKATAKTQKVKLNFYDEANKRQAAEVTIKVKKGAKSVTLTEAKKYLPKEYELDTTTEKLPIRGGYVYIAVRKVVTTQTVKEILYWCGNDKVHVQKNLVVAKDATYVNATDLEIPDGYELIPNQEFAIRDGYVRVELRKVATTQTVKEILYWCGNDKVDVQRNLVVAKDATYVNATDLKIPDGYELKPNQEFAIRDGFVRVELLKAN